MIRYHIIPPIVKLVYFWKLPCTAANKVQNLKFTRNMFMKTSIIGGSHVPFCPQKGTGQKGTKRDKMRQKGT